MIYQELFQGHMHQLDRKYTSSSHNTLTHIWPQSIFQEFSTSKEFKADTINEKDSTHLETLANYWRHIWICYHNNRWKVQEQLLANWVIFDLLSTIHTRWNHNNIDRCVMHQTFLTNIPEESQSYITQHFNLPQDTIHIIHKNRERKWDHEEHRIIKCIL